MFAPRVNQLLSLSVSIILSIADDLSNVFRNLAARIDYVAARRDNSDMRKTPGTKYRSVSTVGVKNNRLIDAPCIAVFDSTGLIGAEGAYEPDQLYAR